MVNVCISSAWYEAILIALEQNSSKELFQCVERYYDHFNMAPQHPLYMNFISSYSNNSFIRKQL
jgi:de-etiolated-1